MAVLQKKLGLEHHINSMPNYTTAGSYCFFTQCIELDALEAEDVKSSLFVHLDSEEKIRAALKVAPLLNHEVKHWYDAHTTLWGLKFLSNIYARRNELVKAENEGPSADVRDFNNQMKLKDSVDLIKFPEYYSTVFSPSNTTRPWAFETSFGLLFSKDGTPSDRSICFTRFMNNQGELIARVPFSLCALLEASAVAQELKTKVNLIHLISDPVSRAIEKRKLQDDTFNELYDENLVEYSVIAHKVANTFDVKDAIEAYSIASKLVRFTLNLTDTVIDKLAPEKLLSMDFQLLWDSYKGAIKHKDLGAVFSLLVDALHNHYHSKGNYVTNENVKDLTEDLFHSVVGVTVEEVDKQVKEQISQLKILEDYGNVTEYVFRTLDLGYQLYEDIGIFGEDYLNFYDKYIPEFVLGDCTYLASPGGLTQQEFDERYRAMSNYYRYLQDFSKACVI